jgi:hypothetical protein
VPIQALGFAEVCDCIPGKLDGLVDDLEASARVRAALTSDSRQA